MEFLTVNNFEDKFIELAKSSDVIDFNVCRGKYRKLLTNNHRLIYSLLLSEYLKTGNANVEYQEDELMKQSRVSKSTLKRALKKLQIAELIKNATIQKGVVKCYVMRSIPQE